MNLPWRDIIARRFEIPRGPAIYFCNGPQCTATPTAVERLLDVGHLATTILYYRGGLHDWITLGAPVEPGSS